MVEKGSDKIQFKIRPFKFQHARGSVIVIPFVLDFKHLVHTLLNVAHLLIVSGSSKSSTPELAKSACLAVACQLRRKFVHSPSRYTKGCELNTGRFQGVWASALRASEALISRKKVVQICRYLFYVRHITQILFEDPCCYNLHSVSKGPFTRAIFVAATRCNFCRPNVATSKSQV